MALCNFLVRKLMFSHIKRHVSTSNNLREVLTKKLPEHRKRIAEIRKKYGNTKIGEINVNMLYGGMRDILAIVCETSHVDVNKGVKFRGYTIQECREKLPKFDCGDEPMPESMFWLLMTGDIPTKKQAQGLSCEWRERMGTLPKHIENMLDSFPKDCHPMSQLSCAIVALSQYSKFVEHYKQGIPKTEYWEYVFEDAMDIIAKLPLICSIIYNKTFHNRKKPKVCDEKLDWTGNYCKMIGFEGEDFAECMRLYLIIHSDHEGANVSAHAASLVSSALSDPYLAYASCVNGLAGPLHGLANQEALIWLTNLQKKFGKDITEAQVEEFVNETLDSGRIVPGYGHSTLRVEDPRFTAFHEYAKTHLATNELCKLVDLVYKVVPKVLGKLDKIKNPWPNLDAHSGCLLASYGMTEMNYYTVLFAMARSLGSLASIILARGTYYPIERPKSITTDQLECLLKGQKEVHQDTEDCRI